MDRVCGSRLPIHGELVTMGRRGRSEAQEVIVIARREIERTL
jgi:hypothetical protein